MRICDWLAGASGRLGRIGIEGSLFEAQVLLCHFLGVSRSWLIAHRQDFFTPGEELEALVQRRESHEPLAYILGYREFYGREFLVDSSVLIPRQDTEVLVETTLKYIDSGQSLKVCDIGTGSGCIAITLQLERPLLDVLALDISADALGVAKNNAEALNAQVQFLESDLFSEIEPDEKFDIVVSNPPYVESGYDLENQVKDFEPHSALFAGIDGMDCYKRIASEVTGYLKSSGVLILEIGQGQANKMTEIFENLGWKLIDTTQDLSSIVRVLVFSFSE